jgi:tetratricopeptide (TPR) repeat protein
MPYAANRRDLGKLGRVGIAFALSILAPAIAWGQPGDSRIVPRQSYLLAFEPFANGDYRSAVKAFQAASRDGVRVVDGRWIDSICFHAMAGESYYQLGLLADALEQYETALSVFLVHSQWMRRIEFPDELEASARSTSIPWAVSSRRPILADMPDRFPCLIGDVRPDRALIQGGVVDPAQVMPVRVAEVVRCTALALARRLEILGPVCSHSRMTNQLVSALAVRPGPANHWSQAWVSAQYGLALAGAGRLAEAETELQTAVLVGGRYDHPLTPLVLLELGKLSSVAGKHEAAVDLFVEAALAGAVFDQQHLVEESLRSALDLHLAVNPAAPFPPLAGAAEWFDKEGVRPLRASLRLMACENAAAAGRTETAIALLDEAAGLVGRREMSSGAIGVRLAHQTACVQFQRGDIQQGMAALGTFTEAAVRASPRLFQIGLVDKMAVAGDMSPRVANELYKKLLADPADGEWLTSPRATLAFASAPLESSYDNWLETALARKDVEQAVEICEQARRRRFLSNLPAAGRLAALRWLLEAPTELLSDDARVQRQEMLLKHPGYAELSKRSAALQDELRALPLAPVEQAQRDRQAELLAELEKTSATQEIILHDIALRREAASFVFPPKLALDELRKAMPNDRLALMFHATRYRVLVLAISRDELSWYRLGAPAKLAELTGRLLKELGNHDKNAVLGARQFADEAWKKSAAELSAALFKDGPTKWWKEFSELVIVPDGPLWYTPFECLLVGDERAEPLASIMRLRYAPLLSLSAPDARGAAATGRMAVTVGRMFPRAEEAPAAEAAAELAEEGGDVSILPPAQQTLPLVGSTVDSLVVLAEVEEALPSGDWMALPWRGPERFVLPAFHTAAEYGLKRAATGDEIFFGVCGLMASGARTILLSRWRTGGQSSLDLTREFVRELPYQSASEAWRRSVLLLREGELDLAAEPRLNFGSDIESVTGEHPFLWAGYMLIDTGAEPKR